MHNFSEDDVDSLPLIQNPDVQREAQTIPIQQSLHPSALISYKMVTRQVYLIKSPICNRFPLLSDDSAV